LPEKFNGIKTLAWTKNQSPEGRRHSLPSISPQLLDFPEQLLQVVEAIRDLFGCVIVWLCATRRAEQFHVAVS
jgi:hypothetical protein